MTELRKLIEEASAIVEICFEPKGQLIAHILTIDRGGARELIAFPMSGPDEERMFRIDLLRRLMAAGHQRWVFFCEAWTALYRSGEPMATQPPKERPDRTETVTFVAQEAATGETLAASRQIYRERPGAPGRLMPLVLARDRKPVFVIDDRRPG